MTTDMSLEPHRSARRDQAPAAGQPAEAGAPGDTAEPSTPDATSAPAGSDAPGAPDAPSASGATAEPGSSGVPGASAEASCAAAREPARDAGPGGWPPGGGRLDESSADLDGPLLADAAGLRASWRRAQARFVDDPGEAVADAASLVEHTAQALAGALRQRQRLLRDTWDRERPADGPGAPAGGSPEGAGPASSGQPAPEGVPDTEQLRLLMHRYRDLFDHICQP
jgi:hypothetical protein